MQLAEQLHAAGLTCFPCYADKGPAVPRGEDWRVVAHQAPRALRWPSGIVGVPVPDGIVIIDLDTYKGVTRAAVEELVGHSIPWDAALLQHSLQGGQHYGFRAPLWPVSFGSSFAEDQIGPGLDTRTGGKSYVATGAGYTPHGAGLFRLAAPASLPVLPDAFRAILEHGGGPRPELPPSTASAAVDPDTVRGALRHLDPGCTRTDWVRIGLAIRAGFSHDEATGYQLFEEWSAGELWPGGCPDNYQPDGGGSAAHQFSTFKPEGDVHIGTLFYAAINAGWSPPTSALVDTAAAFGPGAADSLDFGALLDRIQAEGGNPRNTNDLAEAILGLQCNALQRATLTAVLQRELREAGLRSTKLNRAVEPVTAQMGPYGRNHTVNAKTFIDDRYPGGTLIRSQQEFYAYTGQIWRPLADDSIAAQIGKCMLMSAPQHSTVTGSASMVANICHSDEDPPGHHSPGVIVYRNGALRLSDRVLAPHSMEYRTTCLLPYDYAPAAQCPMWLRFLLDAFSGDQERVDLLQEWMGYMLSPGYEFHKVLLLLGAPRSGKGTIGRMLEQLVGVDNFTGGSLQDFANSSVLAFWRHKTVLFVGDAQSTLPRSVRDTVIERLKQVTGGDKIAFDRKFKSAVSTSLPTRITIAANSLPKLFDDSGALAGRLMPLPIDGSHAGREDHGLFDRLATEIEGVAMWALAGRERLMAQGRFTEPSECTSEAQYIAETYSPVQAFLSDYAEYTPGVAVSSTELYTAYLQWTATGDGDGRRMTQRQLTAAVKDAGAAHGVKYRSGIRDKDGVFRGFVGMTVTAPVAAAFTSNVTPIDRHRGA